jgi:hypothetical protein
MTATAAEETVPAPAAPDLRGWRYGLREAAVLLAGLATMAAVEIGTDRMLLGHLSDSILSQARPARQEGLAMIELFEPLFALSDMLAAGVGRRIALFVRDLAPAARDPDTFGDALDGVRFIASMWVLFALFKLPWGHLL